jgi:hypothetical protein
MRIRLYTELMSKREESETTLRKDMLSAIMSRFFGEEARNLDEKVLSLELMTYNFHESLNLKPLFLDLSRQIKKVDVARRKEFQDRLIKSAKEIVGKQTMILERACKSRLIQLDSANYPVISEDTLGFKNTSDLIVSEGSNTQAETKGSSNIESLWVQSNPKMTDSILKAIVANIEHNPLHNVSIDTVTNNNVTQIFRSQVTIRKIDLETKEVKVTVSITPLNKCNKESMNFEGISDAKFGVTHFDFPMIDNIRLPNDMRFSLVLEHCDSIETAMKVIYFPGSYASLKDKPYYTEVINTLKTLND